MQHFVDMLDANIIQEVHALTFLAHHTIAPTAQLHA
jgi:hypothetical protein